MSITLDNVVTVRFGRFSDDWRKTSVTVLVKSRKKLGVSATNELDPGTFANVQAVARAVGVAAGACAEYLGKRYKDNLDPSTVAQLAIRALFEEAKLQKAVAADAPAKLDRVLQHHALLSDQDREYMTRLKWFVDHGTAINPREVEALDKLIARIHAAAN